MDTGYRMLDTGSNGQGRGADIKVTISYPNGQISEKRPPARS